MENFTLKRNIYPKWFIYFLCWFIPSSKNRKNLKKYIANPQNDVREIMEYVEYIKSNINYNNYILSNILEIVNDIFQYQAGLKICDKNLIREREVVFDFDEAPDDHKVRYHFAANFVDSSDEVLDVACGVGYGSERLARNARSVLGVDLSNASIDFANKIFACRQDNLTYKCADITCENIKRTFDKITCFETIEHIKDDRGFAIKLYDLLKNGGKLICSVPNETVLPFRVARNPFHYRHYTIDEVKNLMESAGFDVESLYFGYHNPERISYENEHEGHTIICICKK